MKCVNLIKSSESQILRLTPTINNDALHNDTQHNETQLASGDSSVAEKSTHNLKFKGSNHKHLSNIDCLIGRTACLVCFISTANGHSKKE